MRVFSISSIHRRCLLAEPGKFQLLTKTARGPCGYRYHEELHLNFSIQACLLGLEYQSVGRGAHVMAKLEILLRVLQFCRLALFLPTQRQTWPWLRPGREKVLALDF